MLVIVFRRPAVAIGAVLCTFGFEQWAQANDSFFVTHPAAINFATGGLVFVGLISLFLRRRLFTGSYPSIGWVVIGLFSYAFVTIAWAVYPEGLWRQWRTTASLTLTMVVLAPLLLTSIRDYYDSCIATLVIGTGTLLLLVFDAEMVGRSIQVIAYSDVVDVDGNPLAIASLASYVALVAILMNFQKKVRLWRLMRWIIVGLAMVVVIRSGSRGQMFALLVAITVFLPVSKPFKSSRAMVGFLISIGATAMLVLWGYDNFADQSRWEWDHMVQDYGSSRVGGVARVLNYWMDSSPFYWFFGLGNSASFAPHIYGYYPHVVIAEVLAEEGLIGLVLLLATFFLVTRSILRIRLQVAHSPKLRGVLAVLGAWLLLQFILLHKQGSLLGNSYFFAVAIMVGRLESVRTRLTPDCRQEENVLGNIGVQRDRTNSLAKDVSAEAKW